MINKMANCSICKKGIKISKSIVVADILDNKVLAVFCKDCFDEHIMIKERVMEVQEELEMDKWESTSRKDVKGETKINEYHDPKLWNQE